MRLARMGDAAALAQFADELDDRCGAHGLDGPNGIAKARGCTVRDGRVLLPEAEADPAVRMARLLDVLGPRDGSRR